MSLPFDNNITEHNDIGGNNKVKIFDLSFKLLADFEEGKDYSILEKVEQYVRCLSDENNFCKLDYRLFGGKSAQVCLLIELAKLKKDENYLTIAYDILIQARSFILSPSTNNSIENGRLGFILVLAALYKVYPIGNLLQIFNETLSLIFQQLKLSDKLRVITKEKWEKQLFWLLNLVGKKRSATDQERLLYIFNLNNNLSENKNHVDFKKNVFCISLCPASVSYLYKYIADFSLNITEDIAGVPILNTFFSSTLNLYFPNTLEEILKLDAQISKELSRQIEESHYSQHIKILRASIMHLGSKNRARDAFRWELIKIKTRAMSRKLSIEGQIEAFKLTATFKLHDEEKLLTNSYQIHPSTRFADFYYNWNDLDTVVNEHEIAFPKQRRHCYIILPVWYDYEIEVINLAGVDVLMKYFKCETQAQVVYEAAAAVYKSIESKEAFKKRFVDSILRALHTGYLQVKKVSTAEQ